MWERVRTTKWLTPRIFAIVSILALLVFVFSASRALAATTYYVNVGGEVTNPPLVKGGMIWYNGYDPSSIVIHPGDTIVWNATGGVHTVTSVAVATNGSFLFDSSPLFTPANALADMGPGKLLAPGSVYDLDTGTLSIGTYTYHCKIHPGMVGHLNVTAPGITSPIVNVVAGWGDHLYAVQAFAPQNLTVTQGTLVRWTLMNPIEPHTITGAPDVPGGPSWDSSPNFIEGPPPPVMLPGQSFSHTFTEAGTFVYFCKVHAYRIGSSWVGMIGIVHVVPLTTLDAVNAAVSGASAVGYGSLGLSIIALLVAVYGAVRGKGPRGASPPKP